MTDQQVLREAADDAACEVLWYLERDGDAPSHVLAHAAALLRAAGTLTDEPCDPLTGGPLDHEAEENQMYRR